MTLVIIKCKLFYFDHLEYFFLRFFCLLDDLMFSFIKNNLLIVLAIFY